MNLCEAEKNVAKLKVESLSGSDCGDSGSDSDASTENEEEEDDNCLLDDEADEEDNEYSRQSAKVCGLFCDQEFENVVALFSHEFKVNKFNLVGLVKKYDLDMISYIKLINYIRSQKPSVDVFTKSYDTPEQFPWADDCYMKTVIENDAALQFDVEEDLDLLESKLNTTNGTNGHANGSSHENESVRVYKAKLKESQAKIEELTEIVEKLRAFGNNLLNMSNPAGEPKSGVNGGKPDDLPSVVEEEDSAYVNSYSNYSIHLEMLQDTVRTQSYMDAILGNPSVFKDKVVLDVGCGSGILSMFAAKAGAKLVIAVDMSNIIEQATQIAEENGFGSDKIVFLKGKVEEVKLPVSHVDIIISEWMGYFLLYESMLDSVINARDKYLNKNGLVLPNFFEMHLYGVDDKANHDKFLSYWSNVYGFKMSCMRTIIKRDAQVLDIDKASVISDLCAFKTIDCSSCTVDDIKQFESEFTITIQRDGQLTGLASSFDTFFNVKSLESNVFFSTSPMHTQTHWQQTLFQFDEPFAVKKDQVIKGKIECMKNPEYLRSYLINISVFDKSFKYILD